MLKRIFVSVILSVVCLVNPLSATADDSFVMRSDVQLFIQQMVKKHGFQQQALVDLFETVKIRPKVMQSIRAPLEHQAWHTYQNVFLTESRIRGGVDFWERNAEALARAEKIYGVPASIIVATIGVETKYGKNKGEYPVIDALTNIAFSGSSRAPYFKSELEEFLLLTREQHLDPLAVKGSYAGAIGQPQFMPSSYRYYAVNFSGNSHIDLSNNPEDIIGSIANYYKKHGWKTDEAVAIPTLVEKNRYLFLFSQKKPPTVTSSDLSEYGIYPYNKISPNEKIKIVPLEGHNGNEYWVSLHNFEVIKRYNPSNLYAMAVYQLSYYISELRERKNHA